MIIWFTGLSGSGKTTLSLKLLALLEKAGFSVRYIDGDAFRKQKRRTQSFRKNDIIKNNLDIISYCRQIHKDYDFIVVAVISPYQQTRDRARLMFGLDYLEIFLDCALATLFKRDTKQLYRRAQQGEIKNLIGFSPGRVYERPLNPDLVIKTDQISLAASLQAIKKIITKKYGYQL